MKKLTASLIGLTAISTILIQPANAATVQAYPDVNAYLAHPVPPPTWTESLGTQFSGWYLYAGVNIDLVSIDGVEFSTPLQALSIATVFNSNESETVVAPDLAFGYNFGIDKIINRIEIEYSHISNVRYNTDPILDFDGNGDIFQDSLFSEIKTHYLMLNIYKDFCLAPHFQPYIMVGAGIALNNISYDASFASDDFQIPLTITSADNDLVHFAWQAGLGFRIPITCHFLLSAGYNYVSLGNLEWDFDTGVEDSPLFPLDFPLNIGLKSRNYHANVFKLGATWQF